eukprot:m.338720 g.338720  ORF g.338720 m.338720 type:complete len:321 (+) comp18520_c0_seq1:180-1142(+)
MAESKAPVDESDSLHKGLTGFSLNDSESNRLSEFKVRPGSDNSHSRRCAKFLEDQRNRRTKRFFAARGIDELDLDDEDDEVKSELATVDTGVGEPDHKDAEGEANGSMEIIDDKGDNKKKDVPKKPFADQLLLSEWMEETPVDLAQNWYFMLCPIGKRCLVISSKGTTICYGRNGKRLMSFPSSLPGGARKQRPTAKDYCILDCVINFEKKIFYVLDLMCWGGHEVYDSDFEFRSYWLQTKFQENPEAMQLSTTNPYVFLPMGRELCTPLALKSAAEKTYPFDVDGILFIHKEVHYVPGKTPLALWLKPDMIIPKLFSPS